MPVSDYLIKVGLLGKKAVEPYKLVIVLLNPYVVADGDKPDQHLLAEEVARTYLIFLHLYPKLCFPNFVKHAEK